MGDARAARHEHADGRVRDRGAPRRRGDRHPRPLPLSRVRVYHADGCDLCARALEVVREVCGDDFEAVDIGGDPELEAAYRESIPVLEIDGERAFTYFVQPETLRERLVRRF
ncbi:MAG TPA: glutaredoxin family protein [Gaiellaceae bacterium]|nr:glutaredoxin family protein [Gaiellaceae bacterium]